MRIEPKRRKSELREIGLPERHEAGRGQVCDDRRVFLLRRRSTKSADPAVVRSPAMSTRSFHATGTPSSGPAARPSR